MVVYFSFQWIVLSLKGNRRSLKRMNRDSGTDFKDHFPPLRCRHADSYRMDEAISNKIAAKHTLSSPGNLI
jgi:hypothetical protein